MNWITALSDNGTPAVQWGVVIVASLTAAWMDLDSRRIPNLLTMPLWFGGLLFAALTAGVAGLSDGFAASVVLALPYVLLFVFARGGAGDAKMMGAIGAWLGLANGIIALCAVAMAGIAVALVYSIYRRRFRSVAANLGGLSLNFAVLAWLGGRTRTSGSLSPENAVEPMLTMPYGLAICIGVLGAATGVLLWPN